MSNTPSSHPPESRGQAKVPFDDLPKILKITAHKKSPHILQPEKIELFRVLFDDLYKYCEVLEGEFTLSSNRDYALYFQVMFEFARSKMQDMYEEHTTDLERMIMHISREMIDDKKKFLPFFLLQMFMLEKGLKRNLSLTERLLAAKGVDEVDFAEVHHNLRQDAQGILFYANTYRCTFITPHPDNVLIGSHIGGQKRYIGTTRTWKTKDMIARAVPGQAKLLDLQKNLDDHIDRVLTRDDKAIGAMFYYLMEMLPTDMPETMVFMGNYVTFDNPNSPDPNQKYLVTIKRTMEKREMDFFKSLLAANQLACYTGILEMVITRPYFYLWRSLLEENPDMRKKVESRPLSLEGKLFRQLFDEADLAIILKPEENGTSEDGKPSAKKTKTAPKKQELSRDFQFFTDIQLIAKRDEINAKITRILNGYEIVEDIPTEVETLNSYVIDLSRHIAQRASSVYRDGFMSPADVAQYLHKQKKIDIDRTLMEFETHHKTKQPTYIDCSVLLESFRMQDEDYPAKITVSVGRKLPKENTFLEICPATTIPSDGRIALPPVSLQDSGKIVYQLTFTAPDGKEFEMDKTTQDITLETAFFNKPDESQKKPTIIGPTEKELELASLQATLLILGTYGAHYEGIGTYKNGIVTIVLDERHMGNTRKIQPLHQRWTISDSGEISPAFEGPEKSMIGALAEKIRTRVREEEAAKTERDKEAQSLSTALIILSEYGDFYEQEGEHDDGMVTFQLDEEHVQNVLSVVGEEGSIVRDHHKTWSITDAGHISPAFEGEERSMILSLAVKIRARVKQEKIEEVEREKLKFIEAIDAEFQTLGFILSDAIDTGDLRRELEKKLTVLRAKSTDSSAIWDQEIARIASLCKANGYLFYRANCENGFPKAITFGKKDGWLAILELQPILKCMIKNSPQEHAQMFRQRIENALMTFAYDTMKNGSHSVEALAEETRAKEDLAKLRKHYKRDLKRKKAKIIAQDKSGQFQIIRNVSRANLETELTSAQELYGKGNVALLLREATYRFQGEQGCIRFDVGKIRATYGDFYDAEIGSERRAILRERIVRTLCKKHVQGATKRGEFIPGSGVDQALTDVNATFERKKGGDKLIEEDIDDAFLDAFIDTLKSGENPVPVSYINHRVAYCRAEDVALLIAD